MRRLPSVLLFAVLAIMLAGAISPARAALPQAKEYHAERFDVLLDIQEGGSVQVTETVTFRFSGEPFTFVFRELDPVETDGYTDLQAQMDGQPVPVGTGPGQVEIDGNRVTWHFAPALNVAHTFTLSYTAQGVIRTGKEDRLIWRAIPPEHDYPIAQSEITLRYPRGVALQGDPSIEGRDADLEKQPGGVILRVEDIDENEELILGAAFPAGSLVSAPPQWQSRQVDRQRLTNLGLPFAFGTGVIALFLLITGLIVGYTNTFRRTDPSPIADQTRYYSPPDNLPPALAARLAGSSQGALLALGSLFDLARRGLIQIDEQPRRFLSKDFLITRLADQPELLPHEQALWELLFTTRRGPRDSLRGSELRNLLASHLGGFDQALKAELEERGLSDPDRRAKKTRFALIGLALILLALAAGIAAIGLGSSSLQIGSAGYIRVAMALGGLAVSFAVAAVIAFILSAAASPLTVAGEAAKARWQGFTEYLGDIAKGREAAIRPDMFQLYLPLAAGIGLAEKWANIFEKTGNLVLPGWFHPLNAASNANIAGFVAVISSASSSASSASAGGAGASGGGASGAG